MNCYEGENELGPYCTFVSNPTAMSPWGKEPFVIRVRMAGQDQGVEISINFSEAKQTLSVKTKSFSLGSLKSK